MSTGLCCEVMERKPGEWYYILEDAMAPQCAFDWHDYATAYGPFSSEQDTLKHLEKHHANPGGFSVFPYSEERKEDDVLQKLLDEAPANKKKLDSFSTGIFRLR